MKDFFLGLFTGLITGFSLFLIQAAPEATDDSSAKQKERELTRCLGWSIGTFVGIIGCVSGIVYLYAHR